MIDIKTIALKNAIEWHWFQVGTLVNFHFSAENNFFTL